MTDNKFSVTELTVPAGATIKITNNGAAIHNVHVADPSGNFTGDFCKAAGPDPCSKPASVPAGGTATLVLTIPPGKYDYRCDFHPADMKGTLTVQ
jgi:plastocyanin